MKKRTILVIIILLAVTAAGSLLWLQERRGSAQGDPSEAVPVTAVAELTGQGSAVGAVNRFGGVAEAKETWSADQAPDSTVREILVSVGDEVRKGDVLFVYDTDKYKEEQEQAEIELERLNNELDALGATIEKLQRDQQKAPAAEQAEYTIRIQDADLQRRQKELDIRSKTLTIEKLQENQKNAAVTSEIDGVVRSINNGLDGNTMDSGDSSAFLTVMKTDGLRIRGTVNEQNIGQIMVGLPVLVCSRVDKETTWTGTVSEIDTNSTAGSQDMNTYYYGGSGESSNYNFYVELDSSDGLMIGQHVYLEPVPGQAGAAEREGLWIPSYLVDMTDPERPYVWADDGGELIRKEVETGAEDGERMMIQILSGLEETDALAFPEAGLEEGTPTKREDAP